MPELLEAMRVRVAAAIARRRGPAHPVQVSTVELTTDFLEDDSARDARQARQSVSQDRVRVYSSVNKWTKRMLAFMDGADREKNKARAAAHSDVQWVPHGSHPSG